VNTGASILIANNILEFLGILKYHPPSGYEKLLEDKVRATKSLHPKSDELNDKQIHDMIRGGQCMWTTVAEPVPPPDTPASTGKKLGNGEETVPEDQLPKPMPMSKEERRQRIEEAAALKVGPEPPNELEIKVAMNLLQRIAENPAEANPSEAELLNFQAELAKDRPQWADCLTAAHTRSVPEDCAEAKALIEHMMDFRFANTVFAKVLTEPCSFPPFEIITKKNALPERSIQPRRFKDPNIRQLINNWTDDLLKAGL